jgi:DNA polymerase-3 subunit epsilon
MTRKKSPSPAKRPRAAAKPLRFAAIDFETADYQSDSACSIGVILVEEGRVVHQEHRLIRPPRSGFVFSYLHGITWEQVEREPSFGELYPSLLPLFEGVSFIAAHNASFDRGVLTRCCDGAGHPLPQAPFLCTVKLARRVFGIYPTNLAAVCQKLDIALKHHDALSDALACARIVSLAIEKGARVRSMTMPSPRVKE